MGALMEDGGDITDAIVGHDPSNGDAHACKPQCCAGEKAGAGGGLLIGQHLHIGQPRMIIDAHMHIPRSRSLAFAKTAISRYPVTRGMEAVELLDVEMDEVTEMLAFVAAHRLRR